MSDAEDEHEKAHLLAGPTVARVHAIGHLDQSLEIRREALREIHRAVHEELDDEETDED